MRNRLTIVAMGLVLGLTLKAGVWLWDLLDARISRPQPAHYPAATSNDDEGNSSAQAGGLTGQLTNAKSAG